ncbi:MAG: hypothetical protein FWF71_07270 [Actinomycetia bacterium]|nr:hypothetical protein [Actinomycetes bacterium]
MAKSKGSSGKKGGPPSKEKARVTQVAPGHDGVRKLPLHKRIVLIIISAVLAIGLMLPMAGIATASCSSKSPADGNNPDASQQDAGLSDQQVPITDGVQ